MIESVTHQANDDQLLRIGEFSHFCRLTTKALRLYDRLDLLRPATVDPSNRYRYYRRDQIDIARLIGLLRGADMSLEEIDQLLAAARVDRSNAVELLDRFLRMLESQHSSQRLLIRHVRTVLVKDEQVMFPIQSRTVGAQRMMSIQRRLHASETDAFVAEARAAFGAHLGDAAAVGPFVLVFHGIVDHENDGPIEAIQGCPDHIHSTDLIGVRTEPAHEEVYTTITKTQWEFPAILAAYDAVACSAEVAARPASKLSCREVYRADPADIDNDDLICDIAFPVG